MLVSKNVNSSWVVELSELSGLSPMLDLGKYLGVMFLHCRKSKDHYFLSPRPYQKEAFLLES